MQSSFALKPNTLRTRPYTSISREIPSRLCEKIPRQSAWLLWPSKGENACWYLLSRHDRGILQLSKNLFFPSFSGLMEAARCPKESVRCNSTNRSNARKMFLLISSNRIEAIPRKTLHFKAKLLHKVFLSWAHSHKENSNSYMFSSRSQSLSLQERCSAYYKCVRRIILMPNMHSSQIHRETEISYIHLWCKNSESGALSSASTSQLEKHHSSALYQRSYPKVSCSKAIGPSIQATEPRCPTSKFRVSRKTSLMKKRAWKQKTWKVCFLVNRFSENTASECPSTLIGHFENGTQAVTTWNVKRPKQSKSSFNKHIDKHWKIC